MSEVLYVGIYSFYEGCQGILSFESVFLHWNIFSLYSIVYELQS